MRLVAAPDGTVDRIDRALWLTLPFDLLFCRYLLDVAATDAAVYGATLADALAMRVSVADALVGRVSLGDALIGRVRTGDAAGGVVIGDVSRT